MNIENLKKEVLNTWLEVDCNSIAYKLGFTEQNSSKYSNELILDTIRCLDHETIMVDYPNVNYVITLIALMAEYVDLKKYNLRKIAIKFLSRIGYSTSAIITDKNFDKENCQYSSLESPMEELLATLNQQRYNIEIKSHKFILTKFQMDIWNCMDKEKIIGISAPTSAGKSFIILLKLLEKLTKSNLDIIYIVPTLSLLNQVSEDFNKYIKKFKINNCVISNTYEENTDNKNHIFVLTQEKIINIFSNIENKFKKETILIVDEIQNIERITSQTDERSKILYDTLNELSYKKNIKQVILSGPRINNIGNTASTIFGRKATVVSSLDSPVLNLTYSICKIDKKYYQFKQYCSLNDKPKIIEITNFNFINGYGQKKYTTSYLKYLNTVISRLSDSQNIIFAPTSRTARQIACSIDKEKNESSKINTLINYYKNSVHEKYSLCNTLSKGVTYHHGKLPYHVRRTLEKAIQEGLIRDIVCTTTLLQGMNLPAQNIIIRTPNLYVKKDKHKTSELTNYEMANLRGRAGRLLKDFIGRTFVLDETSFVLTKEYDQESLFENTLKDLPLDYSERFEMHKESIIQDLLSDSNNDYDEDNEEKNEVHHKDLTTYIRQNILKNGEKAKQKMEKVGIHLTKEQIAAIKLKLEKLTVPKDICFKNRYWDPLVLDFIYNNFNGNIPNFPKDKNVKKNLSDMLKFLRDNSQTRSMYNKHIKKKYRKGVQRSILCNLCIEWAQEKSLKEILSKNVKDNDKMEDQIEDIIELLQNTITFDIPLLLKPIYDMRKSESPFLTCIQAGAYNNTTKTLIEMGIPRECAVYLYENVFAKKDINKDHIENAVLDIIRKEYSSFPYWIQVQLNFLI